MMPNLLLHVPYWLFNPVWKKDIEMFAIYIYINLYINFSFSSSQCKDNIIVSNMLLSGYFHGRGNQKPASTQPWICNIQ